MPAHLDAHHRSRKPSTKHLLDALEPRILMAADQRLSMLDMLRALSTPSSAILVSKTAGATVTPKATTTATKTPASKAATKLSTTKPTTKTSKPKATTPATTRTVTINVGKGHTVTITVKVPAPVPKPTPKPAPKPAPKPTPAAPTPTTPTAPIAPPVTPAPPTPTPPTTTTTTQSPSNTTLTTITPPSDTTTTTTTTTTLPSTTIPSLPGNTQTVDLSIGAPTTHTAQPLGVNIGTMSSYADANVVNDFITQGGSFERANGRILVQTTNGSTSTTLIVTANWAWQSMGGYNVGIGQTLVGSVGANQNGSWTIANMQDQLDSNGNPTGNTVITINGAFSSVPQANDSFFVQITNYAGLPLANSVEHYGNTTIARDLTTAYQGNASARFTFGAGTGNIGTLKYYFGADTTAGRDILAVGHVYQLSFWAKTADAVSANFSLYQGNNGNWTALSLIADNQWHQYTLTVTPTAAPVYDNGIAAINLSGTNAVANIDSVHLIDLTDQISPTNNLSKQTEALITKYGFGDLRFWDPNTRYASFDQMIGSEDSRPMVIGPNVQYDPQLGLPQMLQLAADTHSQLWVTIPTTWTPTDIHNLIEYLGGSTSTTYGAKRAADGHADSWFNSISLIHFEAGNESWNGTFFPNAYQSSDTYFARAQEMFHDFKTDPLYAANASHLSLIANGWQWVPWYTEQAIAHVPDADAIDVSAYTGGPNTPMPINDLLAGVLAEPPAEDPYDYPASILGKQIMVYEEAPGELNNQLSAAEESQYATSLAAGLSTIHNAMILQRDYGISTQNLFTLFQYGDSTPEGFVTGHYGLFSDLNTSNTNPRPTALAAELLNQATGQVLSTSLSNGWTISNTTSVNNANTTQASDAMVTYDATKKQLVVTMFNNTIDDSENTTFHFTLPTTINGQSISPNWSAATFNVLSAPTAASNNETTETATISQGQYAINNGQIYAALPAHSMASFVIPLE